jgi:hypothetical protein
MIKDGMLYWNVRIYIPQEMGNMVGKPAHNFNMEGPISRARALEIA